MKKAKLALDKLALNKETMFNLSKSQMSNLVGGVTKPTDNGCISRDTGCGSMFTNCFSVCQEDCTQVSDNCTVADCNTNFCSVGCTVTCFTNCETDWC